MLKSAYSRIFYFCTIVLIFSAALSGLMVMLFANRQYERETRAEFDSTAQVLMTRIRDLYQQADTLPQEALQIELQDYTRTYNIDCYVFSEDGTCIVRSDYSYTTVTLPDSMRSAAQNAPYCKLGGAYGNFAEETARYVVRFSLDEANYYLMMIIPITQLSAFSLRLILVLVVTILLIALIVAPLFYLNTAQLLKPIVSITHAAEAYANGDFSVRLEPTGGDTELDYLAETMNRMADFIDRNEQSRKRFISNVSHELKTPMTTIGGFVDGILDGTIPPSEEKQYLRTVSGEIQRLSRLVRSMLNLSKFEEGELTPNFAATDLTHLLIKTLLLFEERVEAKQLSVEGLEDCPRTKVECDKDLMQQVFYNLTENAIKFVNTGGTLSVQVISDEQQAHVHLRNTGEGLTEAEISHVFERFYKTDASRGKDTTGVGLGLSIVSRIVRLHGGTITVKSVPQAYTEFVISLPLTQQTDAPPTDRTPQRNGKQHFPRKEQRDAG